MRFRIVVHARRLVREIWYVEADNADEAREKHYNSDSSFEEEDTIDTPEDWIEEIENLDDPTGDLETDEGL